AVPPAPIAAPEPAPPARHRSAPLPANEAALVYGAASALRRQHDPARACALIDSYLARYPSGELLEEALGLAIEAAASRGDARAADYARRYLARFPDGRFGAAAERAQRRFAP